MGKEGVLQQKFLTWIALAHGLSSLLAMAIMSVFGGLATLCGFFEWVRTRVPLPRAPVILALGLFISAVVSLVTARVFPVTLGGDELPVRFALLQKTWFLIVPFTTAVLLKKARFIGQGLGLYLKLAAFLGLFGVVQFFLGWPKFQGIPELPYFHAVLFLGFHLTVASVWFFPTFAGLSVAIEAIRSRNAEWARIGLYSGLLGVVILFLTFSRMAWIALPLALVLLAMLTLNGKVRAGLMALVIAVTGVALATPTVQERIGWGTGKSDRLELWSMSLSLVKERPLTGVGWLHVQDASPLFLKSQYGDRYKDYFWGHAHNQYLEVLAGIGIPGFLIWLLWVLWPLWAFVLVSRDQSNDPRIRALSRGFAIAWVGLLLSGITQVNLWDGKVAHSAMLAYGLAIALRQKWVEWG